MNNNENALTQADGNTKPDPSIDTNLNPNRTAEAATEGSIDTPDRSDSVPAVPPKPPISEAKLRANRENAKKSTGPKTARGKQHSRFNALKHGLVSKKIMFTPEGKLQDEGLLALLEDLRDKYGRGDVSTELLIEGIVIEYWRHGRALELEMECLKQPAWTFCAEGAMPWVLRYAAASDRALRKNLEMLDELQPPTSEAAGDEAEDDAPAPQPEIVPPSTGDVEEAA